MPQLTAIEVKHNRIRGTIPFRCGWMVYWLRALSSQIPSDGIVLWLGGSLAFAAISRKVETRDTPVIDCELVHGIQENNNG